MEENNTPSVQKRFKLPILIAIVVLIISVVVGSFFILNWYIRMQELGGSTACTMEAKICPDGSAVGRTGPNCEFSPCPSASPQGEPTIDTSSWKTYTNKDYSFSLKYPSEFQYINENPNNSVLILNENFKAAQISFSNSNSGLSSSIIFWSTNQQKAIENLNKLIADNSYKKVIVDGSHGVYMEIKATGSTDQPSVHWYYFGRDGKVIAVQGNYVEVKKIEQILSTFTFASPD